MKIDRNFIWLNEEVKSKEELFEKVGIALFKQGWVEKDYSVALKKREGEFPTGLNLPVGFGVAIPHTDVVYARDTTMAIVKVREPIEFKLMSDKTQTVAVKLLFFLVVSDPKKQTVMLKKVMELLQNKQDMKLLEENDSKQTVERVLGNYFEIN